MVEHLTIILGEPQVHPGVLLNGPIMKKTPKTV